MENFATVINKNPFISYTARADREPKVDLIKPKRSTLEILEMNLQEVITTREPRIIPILGAAGSGKTSLFHTTKRMSQDNAYVIYVSPQTNEQHADKLYTSLWFSWIEQYGMGFLQKLSVDLKNKFGSLENLIEKLPGLYGVVGEALFAFTNEDEQIKKTAKFLLGGIKVDNPILPLNKKSFLEDDELCFTAIKLVLKFIDKPVILYFDEIESLFVQYGEQPEVKLLEKIKRIYNECENNLIVLSSLPQVWDRILKLSTVSAVSRFETPSILKRFSKDDLQTLVIEYMEQYWKEEDLSSMNFPSKIWPFSEEDLDQIHSVSDGNPRETIKNLRVLWVQQRDLITKYFSSKI